MLLYALCSLCVGLGSPLNIEGNTIHNVLCATFVLPTGQYLFCFVCVFFLFLRILGTHDNWNNVRISSYILFCCVFFCLFLRKRKIWLQNTRTHS